MFLVGLVEVKLLRLRWCWRRFDAGENLLGIIKPWNILKTFFLTLVRDARDPGPSVCLQPLAATRLEKELVVQTMECMWQVGLAMTQRVAYGV